MAAHTVTSDMAVDRMATITPERLRARRFRDSLFWMVAIAFLLRLGAILVLHTYRFRGVEGNFEFGYEMGRVAQSIASGHGFSNPFQVPSGPTAWEPPLYPYLAAGIFRFFGVYTHASAFVLLTINSLFASLTCIPIYLTAKRTFGDKIALWSAWSWAVLPFVMYWCTRWVWETAFSALILSVLFWLTLCMEKTRTWSVPAAFGVVWGIAAL